MRVAFQNLSVITGGAWESVRGYLREDLERLQAVINTTFAVSHDTEGNQLAASQGQILGQLTGTLAEQPTALDVTDDGLLYFVSDYGHLVRWNGSLGVWKLAPGDIGNGFFRDYAITPQETGWALCDGSATTYLVVGGAALATAAFTTPNLTGTPAYKKSAAAYAAIAAASGTTGTGTTGTGTSGGQSGDHTHNFGGTTHDESGLFDINVNPAGASTAAFGPHRHGFDGTTAGTSNDHTHSVPGLSVPALGVGSLDMAHLNVLPYFRR